MMSIEQACPYCGQYVAINIAEGMSEKERETRAGQRCTCADAVRAREIEEAVDKLRQVCGEGSTSNGFDTALHSDAMSACRAAIEWVIDGVGSEVQIRCAQGDTIKISGTGPRVKIKRKCQKQLEM